jgi:hypothetical protein
MQKRYFERHNRIKHCGLAWIEGSDPIVSYIATFVMFLEPAGPQIETLELAGL